MSDILKVTRQPDETPDQSRARAALTPENLSAVVLTGIKAYGDTPITEIARELKRQTAAISAGDMTRAENMLVAQAHTLDALFSNLANRALVATQLDTLEAFFRLAFKAQSQSRATLQTLAELKAPKHIAFVKQQNIGQNLQVNNGAAPPARTRKNQNPQTELLEAEHGQRLDTRATRTPGRADSDLAPVGAQHRPGKRRG